MRPTSLFGCLLTLLCLASPLLAQNASVSGQVIDAQRASISASIVSLHNTDTGVTVESVTDGRGSFILPPVAPGRYEVKATAHGFAPSLLTNITLEVGESKVVTL